MDKINVYIIKTLKRFLAMLLFVLVQTSYILDKSVPALVKYPKLCENRLGDIHPGRSPKVPSGVSHHVCGVVCLTPGARDFKL